jgi:hypothetical protein
MGKLIYGSPEIEIDFDDRALAHWQIATPLPRGLI